MTREFGTIQSQSSLMMMREFLPQKKKKFSEISSKRNSAKSHVLSIKRVTLFNLSDRSEKVLQPSSLKENWA